jgi:hypothetical protein
MTGGIVFLIALIQFALTVQPSVSFWDCGEFAAAGISLQVPHPPGAPLFTIIGRIFSMLPLNIDPGLKINWISVLASAFSILFLYLAAVKLIENFTKKNEQTLFSRIIIYIAAAIGALSFSFSDTFWFNGVEAEVYASSTVLFALITWLMSVWNEKADDNDNEKYLLMIALLVGLATGTHLMSVLVMVPVVMIVMFRKYVKDDEACLKTGYLFLWHSAIILLIAILMWANQTGSTPPSPTEYNDYDSKFKMIMFGVSALYMAIFWRKIFNRNSIYLPLIFGGIALFITYPGIVKLLPSFLLWASGESATTAAVVFAIILGVIGFGIFWSFKNKKPLLNLILMSLLLIVVGFTTYAMVIIRANQQTPMNENEPNDFSELVSYLNREQYGDFPIFKRRFASEPGQAGVYNNYTSDFDFFMRYQMNHMFNRYLAWNYIGRQGWNQDQGINMGFLNGICNSTIGKVTNFRFGDSKDGAVTYWGIPFLIGLFGIYFHFKKDWKVASVFMILFIFMGYFTAFYQNQQEPQPRERDYFYVGAYFVFSIWIAFGIKGLVDLVQEKVKSSSTAKYLTYAVLLLGILFIPVRMASQNWFTHDRSRNYVPWDYAYNLLQSCAPNAVLFTNGDNDTFPLWFLQDVEGVRRDVRIANLSLLNTSWYIKQLKNTEPYGAMKVDISFSDEQIDQLEPIRWQASTVNIPVPGDVMQKMQMDSKGNEVTASKSFWERFGNIDSSSIKSGRISFRMDPTLNYSNVQAVRVQDLMVRNIIESCKWKRPIYFAVTCSDDSKIGLQDYLMYEGLAHRLVPFKSKSGSDYFMNEDIMKDDLIRTNPGYSKNFMTGFKFRGLNDSTIFFDENHQHLTLNYRNAYMSLALYYLYQEKNDRMVISTLDEMEKKIPSKIFTLPQRYLLNIASIYLSAGDANKYKSIAGGIEVYALNKLKTDPYDSEANRILMELYSNSREYDKVVNLLVKLQTAYPDDPSIKSTLQRYRVLAGQKDSSIIK